VAVTSTLRWSPPGKPLRTELEEEAAEEVTGADMVTAAGKAGAASKVDWRAVWCAGSEFSISEFATTW